MEASSVQTARPIACEEEEEGSGEDEPGHTGAGLFGGATPLAADLPSSSPSSTPSCPSGTPLMTLSPSPSLTLESGLTQSSPAVATHTTSLAESLSYQQTKGGDRSTMVGAKGLIGTPDAVDVAGIGIAKTTDADSQSGRNGRDHQSGSSGVDEMDLDQSAREADLSMAANQRDGGRGTADVENGGAGSGGIGGDLNQNGSEVDPGMRSDRNGGVEEQEGDAGRGEGGRTDQSGKGVDRGIHSDEGGGQEDSAKNGEAEGMDIDQSVSRGAGVGQGDRVRGAGTVRPPDQSSASESELSSEAKESGPVRPTRKRKTPPLAEPTGKGGKRKAPKKPVRKPPPKAKPEPNRALKLQSEPPRPRQVPILTYFEEVEIKGPQGSKLRLVEIVDLTQIWVRPLFPASFSSHIALIERASKTKLRKITSGNASQCVRSTT